jgi:[ribosomal protein S5]-alanine N-acetyltransferase
MNEYLYNTNYQFDQVPTLSSKRLKLRRVSPSDEASLIDISYYDGKPAKSESEVSVILEKIAEDTRRGETLHWVICLKDSDDVVGTCGFYRGFKNNVGEVGYILKEAYRGRGMMTEALEVVIDFGFTTMRLKNIIAYTDKTNVGSINVLKRLAFEEVPSETDYLKFIR